MKASGQSVPQRQVVEKSGRGFTELWTSIDDRDRIDLDKAARVGRKAHDLHRRGGGLGITEIFGPDAVERILIRKICHKAMGEL